MIVKSKMRCESIDPANATSNKPNKSTEIIIIHSALHINKNMIRMKPFIPVLISALSTTIITASPLKGTAQTGNLRHRILPKSKTDEPTAAPSISPIFSPTECEKGCDKDLDKLNKLREDDDTIVIEFDDDDAIVIEFDDDDAVVSAMLPILCLECPSKTA